MNEEQEGVIIKDPNEEGIELPNVDVTEEETLDVETEVEDTEETTVEEEPEEIEEPKENPLQKALNEERKLRKKAEKELKQLKNSKNTSNDTYANLVKQGVDGELAKTIAEAINKPNEQIADLQFNTELLNISKREEFSDIEEYAEDVKSFVDKGLTIEQAYYAATGGKKKSNNTAKDIERKVEAKLKNLKDKASILDVDMESNVATNSKPKLKYSAEELAIAKAAGMTIEEYKTLQGIETISDYDKYEQSKKK